jgi:hypothetical protein
MKINRKDFKGFLTCWKEYELMVTRTLPRFIMRGLYDLSDDLDHALFCRSMMEELFDQYPDDSKLMPYRMSIISLDADLLLTRKEVLARLSPAYCRAYRKRNNVPRSHWWWYLEEAKAETEEPSAKKPAVAGRRK